MKPTEPTRNPVLLVRRLGTITRALTAATVAQLQPQRITPALPFSQWPKWAVEAHRQRQQGDKGAGDTIVHLIGDARSEAFQKWFEEKIGGNCGCTARQAWLNARFPYPITPN